MGIYLICGLNKVLGIKRVLGISGNSLTTQYPLNTSYTFIFNKILSRISLLFNSKS